MKLRRWFPLTLPLLVVAACSSGESDADAMSEAEEAPAAEAMAASAEEALDALRGEWQTHYNLHHPEMVADFYTDSAVVLHADQYVHEGREAITAWLTETMESDPTATITTIETQVFGDQAVSMGTYSVEGTTPEGEALALSGHYMNYAENVDGEWRIAGSITNYDEPRPEDWSWGDPGEEPPENGTMTELVEAYETHYNLQHPDMVADLYTEDAVIAFANEPLLEGREAIAARLTEELAEPAYLDVHDVWTQALDDTHQMDAGWYEVTAGEGGDVLQTGIYMNLVERQDDGSWKIQWMVTNGRPAAMQ